MIKRCERCGLEIADTEYDSQQRFARVKYCTECAAIIRNEQKRESDRKRRRRKRAERKLEKAKSIFSESQEILALRERAKSYTEQAKTCLDGLTEEQRLRVELRIAQKRIKELENQNIASACNHLELIRKYSGKKVY